MARDARSTSLARNASISSLCPAMIAANRERGRVLSRIKFINRNGLRWRDAPIEYGPAKTLYNRWKRWGDKGIFARMMNGLAAEAAVPKTVMIPSHGLRANRCRAADRGYDADGFRDTLRDKGIKPRIPGRRSRTKPVKYDKRRYKHRNRLLAHVNKRCQVAH
jgi:transposase